MAGAPVVRRAWYPHLPTPPGPRRFRSLIPSYIRDSSIAVIAYDISSACPMGAGGHASRTHRVPSFPPGRASFDNTSQWIQDVRDERGSDVIIMLVGNKSDLGSDRKVSVADGQKRAESLGVLFAEASAKQGHNIKSMFKTLAMALPAPGSVAAPSDSQLIDVKLNPSTGNAAAATDSSGNCAC